MDLFLPSCEGELAMAVPTRGLCHSVFLLTYSARVSQGSCRDEWISVARSVPSYMAGALAIESAARLLLDLDLAILHEDGIKIDARLAAAGDQVNVETLSAIAAVLLRAMPPIWLRHAVKDERVIPQEIPPEDLANLEWLGACRDPILLGIRGTADGEFRAWLGNLGELVLVESERQLGSMVTHASKLSDSFGYDVKSQRSGRERCIEVKASLQASARSFYISKNEARVAERLGDSWVLVQVIFKRSVVHLPYICREQVCSTRYITSEKLLGAVPVDTETGTWQTKARISLRDEVWEDWETSLPPSWACAGFNGDVPGGSLPSAK